MKFLWDTTFVISALLTTGMLFESHPNWKYALLFTGITFALLRIELLNDEIKKLKDK